MVESAIYYISGMCHEKLYIMLQPPAICQLSINGRVILNNTCPDHQECVEPKHYPVPDLNGQSWQIFICEDDEKVCSVNTVPFPLDRKHSMFCFKNNAFMIYGMVATCW